MEMEPNPESQYLTNKVQLNCGVKNKTFAQPFWKPF